ncbi:hypothetical protein BC938DRAFT_471379, partial [Jimgerdemannia flammicorona]
MKNLNETQQPPIDNTSFKKLEFKAPPGKYTLQGQPDQMSVKELNVKQRNGPTKECQVEILGFKEYPVYEHDGSSYEDHVDIASHPVSLKHTLRYLQFSGASYRSRTSTAYERAVKRMLERMLKSGEIFLINEVDLKTKTSTFGHMVRGSPTEAAKQVQKVLNANAYRPLFYNAKLRDASALTEALSVGNFGVAEIIVKYCLKDEAKNNSGLLELGYFAIVVGALPIISRERPKWAPLIAQYLSHIQLNRWISEFPETGEFQNDVFARVEQLSNYNQSGLRNWWSKQRKTFGLWWN